MDKVGVIHIKIYYIHMVKWILLTIFIKHRSLISKIIISC